MGAIVLGASEKLPLKLHPIVWKSLCQHELVWADWRTVDPCGAKTLDNIAAEVERGNLDDDAFFDMAAELAEQVTGRAQGRCFYQCGR